MVKMYYDEDADLGLLAEKTIAVIGYGSQGAAQAQNLRDSGLDVIVGLREGGSSWKRAEADGMKVVGIGDAARRADIVHMLLPDEVQPDVYQREIARGLEAGNAISFSHGFNIHYHQIVPPEDVDVFMVAPK